MDGISLTFDKKVTKAKIVSDKPECLIGYCKYVSDVETDFEFKQLLCDYIEEPVFDFIYYYDKECPIGKWRVHDEG